MTATTMFKISRFHGMVLCLRTNREAPTLAVNSATGDWRSDIGIGDSTVIDGEIETLDRMSIEEWLSLHRDDLAEAWHLLGEGHSPDPVEALPDDWPIGGPPPTRGISVKPLEGCRIRVEWDDGSAGELDLAYLTGHPVFAAWSDRGTFESVRIVGSSFTWGGEMELCAWLGCWPTLDQSQQEEADTADL